ncbi:MAG: hypothetical protein J2P37_34375, partial [Ktedonobacteraceae bacterium]|nr:hypothetical protein [Ktedonobacteraceae bacterium]
KPYRQMTRSVGTPVPFLAVLSSGCGSSVGGRNTEDSQQRVPDPLPLAGSPTSCDACEAFEPCVKLV